jgi:RHS repeat-associated protein
VVTYTHDDHLGSPVAATDAAGAVAWRESFEPFGGKLIDPFGNKDDQGFAGHVSDAATGLVYMQARYYDPVIGRFLSVDPVNFSYGKPQSFNRYAYVANDPVNGRDSTGLEEDEAEITVTANCPPYCRSREGIPILVSPIPDPMPPPTWPEWHWRFSPFTPLRNICSNIGIFCSKPPADAKDPTGAKAPGKPGMDEGFNDPDTGEEWGKVEKGPMAGKSGWVDADDKIWVPTGQGSAAHGRGGGLAGAHWDVQDRQGRGHVNVYPGGHRR